jgi:Skp family chaperone for outer membrane proteins
MRSNRTTSVIVILAALLLAGWSITAIAQQAQPAHPTRVAVVDVEKVFNALEEKTSIEAGLQGNADKLKQDGQRRQGELKQMEEDLGILAPGSDAYTKKQEELLIKAAELRAWGEVMNKKLQQERGLQIGSVYRKMLEAIGRIAKQGGYDLVLFKEKEANFATASPETLSTLIQVRKVLYSADDMDLTDRVIQVMNNEFRNMVGTKPR